MEQTTPYTLTTTNIRFPTFYNKDYENEIEKPVSIESFIQELSSFQSMLNQLQDNYLNLIVKDQHHVVDLILQCNRIPISYILLMKELNRMTSIVSTKAKKQFGINEKDSDAFISTSLKQSIDDVIESFIANHNPNHNHNDSNYYDSTLNLVNLFYSDKNNMLSELLMGLYRLEKNVLQSSHRTGITLLSNVVKFSKLLLKEINDQIASFRSITKSHSKNKSDQITKEIILLDLIIKVSLYAHYVILF